MAIFVFRFIREWDPAAGGLEVIVDVPTNLGFPSWTDVRDKLRQEILANRIRLDVQDCFFTYTATTFVNPSSPPERNYITNDIILRRAVERAGQVFGEEVRLEITISVINPGPPPAVVPVGAVVEPLRQEPVPTSFRAGLSLGPEQDLVVVDKDGPVVPRKAGGRAVTAPARRARSGSAAPARAIASHVEEDADVEAVATPRKKTKRASIVAEQTEESPLIASPYTHRPVISKLPLPPGHRFIAYKYAHIPKRSTTDHPLQRTPAGDLHMCLRLDRTPSFPRTIRLPSTDDALVASLVREATPVAIFVQARLHFPTAHYHSRVGHTIINSSGWVLMGRYTIGQAIDSPQPQMAVTGAAQEGAAEYPVSWVDVGRGVLCQGRCDERHREYLRRVWGEEKLDEIERDKVNRVTVCDCLDE